MERVFIIHPFRVLILIYTCTGLWLHAQHTLVRYGIVQNQLSPDNTINTSQYLAGNLSRGGIFDAAGTQCAQGLSSRNPGTTGEGTLSFTLTPMPGYRLNLTEIQCGMRRTANGAATLEIDYIQDSGPTNQSAPLSVPQVTCLTSTNNNGNWNFSDIQVNAGDEITITFTFSDFGGNAGQTQVYELTVLGSVECMIPGTQASSLLSDSPEAESIPDVQWTSGNGAGRILVVSEANPVTFTPVNGTEYTTGINADFSLADDRGSNNRIVYAGTGNSLASLSGLNPGTCYYLRVYEYNCSGGDITYNTQTATQNPVQICTQTLGTDAYSDIILNPSFTFDENLMYQQYQSSGPLTDANSLAVLGLRLRDGGEQMPDDDAASTSLTSLTISTGGNTYIRQAGLFQGSTLLSEVQVNGNILINFSGLNIIAVDDQVEDFELRITFLDQVQDRTQLQFSVNGAVASGSGSVFAQGNAGGAASPLTGDINRIQVVAGEMVFLQQPSQTRPGLNMAPPVLVEATDALGNRDIDFTEDVRITSSGTLAGSYMDVQAVLGLAEFPAIIHNDPGSGLELTAQRTLTLDWNQVSNPFDINNNSVASDYFRSRQSGNWSDVDSWESSADSLDWTSPATLSPNYTSASIVIQTGHSLTLDDVLSLDQTLVQAGATMIRTTAALTLNNGVGTDLRVFGLYLHAANAGKPLGTGTMRIESGGVLEVTNANVDADGYANDRDGFESRISYGHNATFYWNVSSALLSSNRIFFVNQPANEIPIIRFGFSPNMGGGAGNNTTFNGLISIDATRTLTLQNGGLKILRNGITGAGTLTQAASSGEIRITAQAIISGSGSININTNGIKIINTSSTQLLNNKTINGNRLTVAGTLDVGNYQISGDAEFLLQGVFITTKEEGFHGSTSTSLHQDINLEPCATGSEVILAHSGNQVLTPAAYHHVRYTGAGVLTLSSDDTIYVSGNFRPGTGTHISTGSTVELNGTTAQTLTQAFEFEHLIIRNTSVPSNTAVTISSGEGNTQVIRNTITPYQGALITNGNLHLLSNEFLTASVLRQVSPTGEIIGDVQVERYVASSAGHRFLSTPLENIQAGIWYQHPRISDIYWYEESVLGNSSIGWLQAPPENYALETGRGYFANFATGTSTLSLTGSLNQGTVNFPGITFTVDPNNRSASGWALVGNPYACTIDWDASSGWTRTNISTAIFYQDPITGQKLSYNNGVGTLGASRYIPQGQGIWVKAFSTNPVLTCSEEVKVNQASAFFKQAEDETLIRVIMQTDNLREDAVIRFRDDIGYGVHPEYEVEIPPFACQFQTPYVYLPSDNQELAIKALPENDLFSGFEQELVCISPDSESYQLEVWAPQSLRHRLEIEDLQTHIIFNTEQPLSFSANRENNKRFLLRLKPKNHISGDVELFQVFPNPANDRLYLTFDPASLPDENSFVQVLDVMGNEYLKIPILSKDKMQIIKEDKWAPGIYFIGVHWGGIIHTKKVIFN